VSDIVTQTLDELVPEQLDAFGDWDDVLRRAHVTVATPGPVRPRRRSWTRRRVVLAALVAVIVALFATPAFGLLRDWIGRTDVPFTGKAAPHEVQRNFFDMSLQAPPNMSPGAIASQTRRVGVFHENGKAHILYVAPTRAGGFCWVFSLDMGSCRRARVDRRGSPPLPGEVNPHLLIVGWGLGGGRPLYTKEIAGDMVARGARALWVEYEDGSKTQIPFVWVSKPIDAGFFMYGIPAGHRARGTRVSAVSVRSATGRVLTRDVFVYEPVYNRTPRRPPSSLPLPLPPPKPPFQRGSAGGVSVTVGSNRIAVFEVSGATARVRTLIRRGSYGCFRFIRFHEETPFSMNFSPNAMRGHAIPLNGLAPPYDGCEIQGAYGHTWPDRNESHSAVEIPFTARARAFFADRAAARDLGLFVTSRARNLARPSRISVHGAGGSATYTERSATGRRFYVVVRDGKVVDQNVRTLAAVR
jgi:hypothetical protein